MDYRLPGMDGVQATAAVKEAHPEIAVVCLTASANAREIEALYEAGATACLTKDQELDDIVDAVKRRRRQPREPHRAEHGDRRRLDRGLPRRARPLPELARRPAVRQLRHRQLQGRRRPHRARSSTSGCAPRPSCRRRRSRRRATSSRPTRSSAAYERILSVHIAANLSGTFQSAGTAAAQLGDGRVRTIDSETRVGRDRDARDSRSSAGSSAARPTRRSTRSSSATCASTACSSPSTRSSSSRAAAASGARRRSPASCCT